MPQHQYIGCSIGTDALYHCEEDPHEWVNQSETPEFADITKKPNALLSALNGMPPGIHDEEKNQE